MGATVSQNDSPPTALTTTATATIGEETSGCNGKVNKLAAAKSSSSINDLDYQKVSNQNVRDGCSIRAFTSIKESSTSIIMISTIVFLLLAVSPVCVSRHVHSLPTQVPDLRVSTDHSPQRLLMISHGASSPPPPPAVRNPFREFPFDPISDYDVPDFYIQIEQPVSLIPAWIIVGCTIVFVFCMCGWCLKEICRARKLSQVSNADFEALPTFLKEVVTTNLVTLQDSNGKYPLDDLDLISHPTVRRPSITL